MVSEAAGVGAWGRTFQVWALVSLGHLGRCRWSVDGSDEHSVSELTTNPRMGQDCWSRGLQSACFWLVAGWRVVHRGRLLVRSLSIARAHAPRQSAFWRIACGARREQRGLFGAVAEPLELTLPSGL